MHLPFSKYSGCGNDFILIDNRQSVFDVTRIDTIVNLCHRRLGIGADGIIFLESSSKADFRMRIFNTDGSEAEMCGNGLRCLIRFIQELGIECKQFVIETMHQIIPARVSSTGVSVAMPPPTDCHFFEQVHLEDDPLTLHRLDTGVPHAVLFVENLHEVRLMSMAPQIRYFPRFLPKGTNVNFAVINANQEVEVRTYERGVEGETLACGTGAVAAALAAARVHGLCSPITIRPKSGDKIDVAFVREDNNIFSNVIMSGPAIKIFSGTVLIG